MEKNEEKKKVLFIDDSRCFRTIVASWFRRNYPNLELVCVENGRKGLEQCNCTIFDFVLTDMMMPEMGGQEFLSAFRKFNQITPVALTSGNEMTRVPEGFVAFLPKPFEDKELRKLLENYV